ncbi:MAG TPA: glycerophosphodiester phosphodiesterase [Candidatus Saccharimonadales bacterium]|nr:glycerophosphodiester phosphodiesterase [Candidatus Saccharimonadales bacterium]
MKIIGHRGAKGLEPENTLRSFKKALEHHVDQLELDLRATRDGVVVVHHDPEVRDPAGNRLTIKAHTLAQLRDHKSDLLTFEELLAAVKPSVHLLVEIKPREPTGQIIAILREQLEHRRSAASLSIGSFDQGILRTMHAAFPDVEMVVIERWSAVRAQWRARQVSTKRLNMRSWWLWSGVLLGLHRGGYQVVPYTMNDPAKARRWQRYLYGVITDRPDLFER